MTTGTMNQRSRAPRHPRADGERTRAMILRAAASLATVDGLEGLSIGNLATATGISKSGLYAHFGSKQELQLATVDEAERILTAEVIQPALAARPGVAQLAAVCEAYFSYVERRVFPGGCFFAATALEMGTRPGPVKDRVAAIQSGFTALLAGLRGHRARAARASRWRRPRPARLRAARDPAGRRHQIRPAGRPGRPGPGPPGRPPAARTGQRRQRRRKLTLRP